MNLPADPTDLFMTLRYVSASALRKLHAVETVMDPLDVIPEIIHLGFWYSNTEAVEALCKLLNKLFTPDSIEAYYRAAHDMQNILLMKLLTFWLAEVTSSLTGFPQVGE